MVVRISCENKFVRKSLPKTESIKNLRQLLPTENPTTQKL